MLVQIKAGCDVEVDGGIDGGTAPLSVAAGANVLVVWSEIIGESEGIATAMHRLRASIQPLEKQTARV